MLSTAEWFLLQGQQSHFLGFLSPRFFHHERELTILCYNCLALRELLWLTNASPVNPAPSVSPQCSPHPFCVNKRLCANVVSLVLVMCALLWPFSLQLTRSGLTFVLYCVNGVTWKKNKQTITSNNSWGQNAGNYSVLCDAAGKFAFTQGRGGCLACPHAMERW